MQDNCLQVLEHFPHLRTLVIPISPYMPGESLEQNPKDFFLRAGVSCPQLSSVHLINSEDWRGRWDIIRERGRPEPVKVVSVCRPGAWKPEGWTDTVDCSELPGLRWCRNELHKFHSF